MESGKTMSKSRFQSISFHYSGLVCSYHNPNSSMNVCVNGKLSLSSCATLLKLNAGVEVELQVSKCLSLNVPIGKASLETCTSKRGDKSNKSSLPNYYD